MSPKYKPLQEFLADCRHSCITLTFARIERAIGAKLPPSARKRQAWWANSPDGQGHCRAWLEAGWRTENLSLARGRVDFVRIPGRPADGEAKKSPPRLFGMLAGTVTIHDPDALTAPSGERWAAQGDD